MSSPEPREEALIGAEEDLVLRGAVVRDGPGPAGRTSERRTSPRRGASHTNAAAHPTEATTRVPWWRRGEDRQSYSGRETLSRDQITQAALELIDHEGLGQLSMRGVAARLGVGTMSLYWHVRNKEELLWLVVDELLADVPLPDEGPDPFTDIAEIARGLRGVLLRHRRAVPVLVGRPGFGPNGLVFGERLLAAIHSAGFSGDTAADAYAMCVNYTTGFVLYEVLTSDITWTGSSTAESLRHELATYLGGLPAATFPNLRSGGERLIWAGGDASFDFGLNALLDGLELSRLRSRDGKSPLSLARRSPSDRR